MEATTIKLEADVKRDLEALRAELEVDVERRVSYSQVVARLVKMARNRPFAWWGADREAGWTEAELESWISSLPRGGIESDASTYKDVLYGDEP